MKKHIITIEISTKKGHAQKTQWEIWRDRVYPCIKGHSSSLLHWDNTEKLFPRYGSEASGLAPTYSAILLADNYTPEGAKENRQDYAGYEGNGGTITLRGLDLGETGAEIRAASPHCGAYISYKVRGYGETTEGERKFLDAQVSPVILAYVQKHAKSLKAECVAIIKARFKSELKEARARLAHLAELSKTAIY